MLAEKEEDGPAEQAGIEAFYIELEKGKKGNRKFAVVMKEARRLVDHVKKIKPSWADIWAPTVAAFVVALSAPLARFVYGNSPFGFGKSALHIYFSFSSIVGIFVGCQTIVFRLHRGYEQMKRRYYAAKIVADLLDQDGADDEVKNKPGHTIHNFKPEMQSLCQASAVLAQMGEAQSPKESAGTLCTWYAFRSVQQVIFHTRNFDVNVEISTFSVATGLLDLVVILQILLTQQHEVSPTGYYAIVLSTVLTAYLALIAIYGSLCNAKQGEDVTRLLDFVRFVNASALQQHSANSSSNSGAEYAALGKYIESVANRIENKDLNVQLFGMVVDFGVAFKIVTVLVSALVTQLLNLIETARGCSPE